MLHLMLAAPSDCFSLGAHLGSRLNIPSWWPPSPSRLPTKQIKNRGRRLPSNLSESSKHTLEQKRMNQRLFCGGGKQHSKMGGPRREQST
jgi:hypothetical protein